MGLASRGVFWAVGFMRTRVQGKGWGLWTLSREAGGH